jgi:hypothetical protein
LEVELNEKMGERAMGRKFTHSAVLALISGVIFAGCGGGETSAPVVPAVVIQAGGVQNGTVGQVVAVPPSVRVTSDGSALSGQVVNFAVASGGGSITGASATTNASGVAAVGSWTLGTVAGANTLTATVSGASGSPLTFTATANAGPAAELTKGAGDGQSAKANQAVAIAPSVTVKDEFENPVAGVQVTFAATAGGGVVTGGLQTTNGSGVATVTSWVLGPNFVQNTLTATIPGAGVDGNPATFTAQAQEVVLQPAQDTTLTAGTIEVSRLIIPAGRTVTVTGNVIIEADSSVLISGNLVGNCVGITIDAAHTVEITGAVNNGCAPNTIGQPLTIIGRDGYSLDGATITSGGNVTVTDNPALAAPGVFGFVGPPRLSLAGDEQGLVTPGSCDLRNVDFVPQPQRTRDGADGVPNGEPGSSGFEIGLYCGGNLRLLGNARIFSQSGGNGGNGSHQSLVAANSTGGLGGKGGITRLVALGKVVFSGAGNRVEVGAGGSGGNATATALNNDVGAKAPGATARGGNGREMGALDLRGAQGIDVLDQFEVVFGDAGSGGNATAVADDGRNATGTEAAQAGGDADAQGGLGGSSPQEVFVPPVSPVTGAEKADFKDGDAGVGGSADASGGNGGNGNDAFPNGAMGGNVRSVGAMGGTSFIKDLQNIAVGVGGNGGSATFRKGKGGNGVNKCPIFCPGGNGGMGGASTGGDGAGGASGLGAGARGITTLVAVSNGGNAGSGFMPGARGLKGTNGIAPAAAGGGSFVDGLPAIACVPGGAFALALVSILDPAMHNEFVRFCTSPSVSLFGGGTTMGMSFGASPGGIGAFSVSGATGPFPLLFTTSAIFSGVLVPVQVALLGVNAAAEVNFSVEIGGPGSPPMHPLNVPIIYFKKFTLPGPCNMGPQPSAFLSSVAAARSLSLSSGVREEQWWFQ